MPTLILDEIHKPRSIVALLPRIKDNGVFIIEPIGISIWKGSSKNSDLASDTILFHRTLGYNVTGFYHYNKMLHKEFIFILKNNGAFLVLDSQLQVIDSINIGVTFRNDHKYIFKYDEINNHLYLNLTNNEISMISFKVDKNNLYFLHSEKLNSLLPIYKFSAIIIDFDISYHYNEYILEEFQTIAVLLKSDNRTTSPLSVKVIYRVNPRQKRSNSQWHILLPNVKLNIDNLKKPSFKNCLIDTIPNIGFIIFTSNGFTFLTLPHGPQNIINGKVIQDIYDQIVSSNATREVHTNQSDNFYNITLRKNITTDFIKYQILTTKGIRLTISFTKIKEEDEKYIIYWKQDLQSHHISYDNNNIVIETYFFKSTIYDYLTLTQEGHIKIYPFDNQTPPKILSPLLLQPPLSQSVSLYSSISSNIINNYISTGITSSKKAFFHMVHYDFHDYFTYQKNNLSQNDIFKENKHIDESILYKVPIRKTTVKSVCEIAKNMSIRWTHSLNQIYKLKEIDIKSSIVLDSLQSYDGRNITTLGIDNEILIIEDCTSLCKRIKIQNDTKIASIYIQEHVTNDIINRNIWLSDYNCFIWIINYDTGSIKDKFKLHYKVLKFCDPIPTSTKSISPILYGKNCIIISKMDSRFERLKLIWLSNLPFNFNVLAINAEANKLQACGDHCYDLSLVINKNLQKPLLQTLYLDEDDYIFKYVRLSPCSPFLICVTCDRTLNTTYLKLFNIHEKRFCHSINLTKLYPQSLVSDITTLPYLPPPHDDAKFEASHKEYLPYAERVILDQCFVVSLNYEMAENETDNNLLLYLLDDDTGQLIYQTGINTGSSITCIQNYLKNNFLVGGDTLEIYKINYSVKWNSFIIKSISNRLELSGLIKNISILDGTRENRSLRKNILLLDILRGLRNVSFTINESVSDKELIYKLQYVTNSNEHVIIGDNARGNIITNFETVYIGECRWFILSLDANKVKIYYNNNIKGEEYASMEFYLPNEILNITTMNDQRYRYSGNKRNSILYYEDTLFLITTRNGGIYSISQANEVIKLSPWKQTILHQQLKYTTEEEINEDDDNSNNIIKNIYRRILSEYNLYINTYIDKYSYVYIYIYIRNQ